MFGLSFGSKKVLGVDIGTSSLKVIELEVRNGKPYLSNYAWMTIPVYSKSTENEKESMEEFGRFASEYLGRMMKKAGIKKSDAYVSIPSLGGLITLIDFPMMSPEDMEQAIRFEAHKYIPTSLDEVSISWEIVGEQSVPKKESKGPSMTAGGDAKVQVLLVAASKPTVLAYEKMAKDAGLRVRGVEIESISMVDSLVGNDKGNFVIVDIGHRMCNILYVEKGIIRANRNIDAGGDDLTRSIAKGLGVTKEKAESLKMSGRSFLNDAVSLHFSTLDVIMGEVKRVIDSFSGPDQASNIDSLILSGGSANFSGLKEIFQSKLNIRTIIGNPFGRLEYDKKLDPHLEGIKGRFAVCAGLALKGVKDMDLEK